MNIFTRKKTLLATIANLEEQIRIQSNEMDKLRKANTDNRLWRDAVKENKRLQDETIATKESMRAQGMEHATALGEKNQTIEGLLADIAEKDHTIAELHDTTSGLASSVSDLKAKLKAKSAKVTQLTRKLEELKAKDKPKTTKP
jgi:chromosome segregation ATPase